MGPGVTLDTGALIGLERRRQTALRAIRIAREARLTITVPAVAVAEWWRGQEGISSRLLDGIVVEPLTRELAMAAGEALARTGGANAPDAIVVESAAQRGDVVLTSDPDDLEVLARYRGIRIDQV